MKNKLFALLAGVLVGTQAFAATSPFMAELEAKLLHVDKKTAKVVYAPASNGGASTVYNLGVALPAKAIVTRAFAQVVSPFAQYGTGGTVAIACGNITFISARDMTAYATGQLLDLTQTGASSVMDKLTGSSACQMQATIATRQYSAGKVIVWAEYVVTE